MIEVTMKIVSTRWTSRVSLSQFLEDHVTKFAPYEAMKSIVWRYFDDRLVVHCVDSEEGGVLLQGFRVQFFGIHC
jgi:hypothetical protein